MKSIYSLLPFLGNIMAVNFHNQTNYNLSSKTKLKAFLEKLFTTEGKQLDTLDIIFCDDEYLLQINRDHLAHDYYTDIITFDLSPSKKAATIAELYISIDRVKDNAKINKVTISNELHRVIFHGCLHLSGFKDKKPADIITMRKMEDKYLGLYFK